MSETGTVHWPWDIQMGGKLKRVEVGLELRGLWWMDLQSQGEMYKLTSQCWYVSAAHVTQAFVVTACLRCIWVCEDISFYSYESFTAAIGPHTSQVFVCFCTGCTCGCLSTCIQLWGEGGGHTFTHKCASNLWRYNQTNSSCYCCNEHNQGTSLNINYFKII